MKNKSKSTIWIILGAIILLGIGVLYFVFRDTSVPVELTTEAQVVQDAFDASIRKKQEENSSVDNENPSNPYALEKTIEIIHGLDLARGKSGSFKEYMEFMARQDYTGVAPDVLEAKSKILPILSKLQKAEERLEETQAIWNTFKTISEVVIRDAASVGSSAATGGFNPKMIKDLIGMGKNSFEIIREQKELEEGIKNEIDQIEDDYIRYLEVFMPVYMKYMREWDRVCLLRDNAYLEIHQGNLEAAMISVDEVLKIDPKDREGLILKSFCLLNMESMRRNSDQKQPEVQEDYAAQAQQILEQYTIDFPDKSAPALLLLGTYYWMQGEMDKSIAYYDQSSVEYPRQSEQLLNMLNSYQQRTYLRKTAEGSYILQMYKSTMEGFGFFSPNFQKGMMYSNKGEYEKSKDEILRHFFRRGNQGVFDFMIADMTHCETYLPKSYNLIFSEKSFLDLEANTSMWDSKELNIKIKNRSDLKLSNVRVFLCLHFTDMYADDYEVFKVNTTVNNIEPYSTADFGNIEINFELFGKEKRVSKDIVSARAIIVTDNFISWVDKEDFKVNVIKTSLNEISNSKQKGFQALDDYYEPLDKKGKEVFEQVRNKTTFVVDQSLIGKDHIKVSLPRLLVYLNPYFSINELNSNEAVLPESVTLNGSKIDVSFDQNIPENGKLSFFVSAQDVQMKWDLFFDADGNLKEINHYLL